MCSESQLDACLVFLVRHGATANNLANPPKIQGQGSDLGLSGEGKRQAARAARLLEQESIAAAFSSPLRRAFETASIISEPHHLEPVAIEGLKEVDVGRWENRSWREIAGEEPDRHRRFLDDPATYGYAGGENLTQLLARVRPTFEQILQQYLGRSVLVVGHNVVNRVLLATYLEVPLRRAREIHQDNCGVNVLRYRDGRIKVLTANAAFHLRNGNG